MCIVEAAGPLPMRLDAWIEELSYGWYDETKIADVGDKGKAVDAPSPVKLYDPADVDTGNSIKPLESPNPFKLYDPTDVDTSDTYEEAAELPGPVETHKNPDSDAGDKGHPAVKRRRTEL